MFDLVKKSLKNPDKAKRVLKHRLLSSIQRNTEFKKVIVIGRARTGSNLLLSYMNSHPELHMEGEIFAFQKRKSAQSIIDSVYKLQPDRVKAAGFKIFYHHPMDNKESNVWELLKSDPSIHVIQLRRENMLRMHISRKIAMQSDVWTAASKKQVDMVKNKRVSFTKAELEEGFNKTKRWESDARQDFSNHPFIEISYERMISDPVSEFSRLTSFLEVDEMQPQTNLRKQNAGKLSDLIENYDSLKTDFQDTEWQRFFD